MTDPTPATPDEAVDILATVIGMRTGTRYDGVPDRSRDLATMFLADLAAAGWTLSRQQGDTVALPALLCPEGCGCRLWTDDADGRDCACGGPCCWFSWDDFLKDVVDHPDEYRARLGANAKGREHEPRQQGDTVAARVEDVARRYAARNWDAMSPLMQEYFLAEARRLLGMDGDK